MVEGRRCTVTPAARIGSCLISCKCRGFCPSHCGRRMADTAAHLVDRAFPEVPVRCPSPSPCATASPTTLHWSGVYCRFSCAPCLPRSAAGQAFSSSRCSTRQGRPTQSNFDTRPGLLFGEADFHQPGFAQSREISTIGYVFGLASVPCEFRMA